MKRKSYQPDRGDIAWLQFTPKAGTEQAGRRPALILSPKKFNIATGLAFACPITSHIKGGGFEVPIEGAQGMKGVILCDHLRSVDWIERNAEYQGHCPETILEEVVARLGAILSSTNK